MTLKVYTSQYSYRGEDRLDTTVKTSDKIFAPTWDMVMRHKNGSISDEEYTKKYYNLMRQSYIKHKNKWDELLSKEKVTLVCFCKAGKFCHRLILKDMLVKLGAEYRGEVSPKDGSLVS